MELSRLLFLELLLAFSCTLADEWSVLPAPAAPKPPAPVATDWQILDSKQTAPVVVSPQAAATEWAILPMDGKPDKGTATDGHNTPRVSPPIPKPIKLACSADCVCGACECGESCYCCGGFAKLEAESLKSGKSAILYVGTRKEDADAARREANARGLLFMAAKSVVGFDDADKPEPFPAGTHELKPIGKALFFVPRGERKNPIPDARDGATIRNFRIVPTVKQSLTVEECAT